MIRAYLNFILKSKNKHGHGVHSPFVFRLITRCFKSNIDKNLWETFTTIKQQLLDNKIYIKVTDFGSGSKIFKSNYRQVSKISKVAGISTKKAKLLIKITSYFKPKHILEVGTSLGLGTLSIKIGNKNSTIQTLEGCRETASVAKYLFFNNKLNNINITIGNFEETLPKTIQDNLFDCIYFDGNHTKKATLNYFNTCLPTIQNNSFWIFDDIYWNTEMQEAWTEIKKHPKVTVTVDVFHFGIVFFRKEQAKEHFKIRV